jgi:hypothetical protein
MSELLRNISLLSTNAIPTELWNDVSSSQTHIPPAVYLSECAEFHHLQNSSAKLWNGQGLKQAILFTVKCSNIYIIHYTSLTLLITI